MKRIVICCDGTWNSADQADENQHRADNQGELVASG